MRNVPSSARGRKSLTIVVAACALLGLALIDSPRAAAVQSHAQVHRVAPLRHAAAVVATLKTGVRILIRTPAGVPANVYLARGRSRVQASKAAAAGRAVVFRALSPGRYAVRPQATVWNGHIYAAAGRGAVVVVRRAHVTKVTVTYALAPTATNLKVTKVTRSSISLAWQAARGSVVRVRRMKGSAVAQGVSQGTAVSVKGTTARAASLRPLSQYTFSLFTRIGRTWSPALSVTASTASTTSRHVLYVTGAKTVIAAPGSIAGEVASGDGLSFQPRGSQQYYEGSVVVLPESKTLPGGFIGKVTAISPSGFVTVAPSSVASAFPSYDVSVALPKSPITLTEMATTGKAATGNHPSGSPASCLEGGGNFTVGLNPPKLSLAGSYFHAALTHSKVLGQPVPSGVDLNASLSASVTFSVDISASAAFQCQAKLAKIFIPIPSDPIPLGVYISPSLAIGVSGQTDVTGLGFVARATVSLSGHLGLTNSKLRHSTSYSASPVGGKHTAQPSVSVGFQVQQTFGPGFGAGPVEDSEAGAIAGGSFTYGMKLSAGPLQGAPTCWQIQPALPMQVSLNATAWYGNWNESLNLLALNSPGVLATWYVPPSCNPEIDGTLTLDAPAKSVTFSRASQYANLSIKLAKGTRLGFNIQGFDASFSNATGITIKRPNGSTFASLDAANLHWNMGGFAGPYTTDQDGTWHVIVTPPTGDTTGGTIQVVTVPPDLTGRLDVGAPATPITFTGPGQNAAFTFGRAKGARFGFNVTGFLAQAGNATEFTIIRPDGTVFGSFDDWSMVTQDGGFAGVYVADQGGTWKLIIDPPNADTTSGTVEVFAPLPDLTGRLDIGAAPTSVTFGSIGQNAVYTFGRAKNAEFGFNITDFNWSFSNATQFVIKRPDGTVFGTFDAANLHWNSNNFSGPWTADQGGTWKLVIDPQGSDITGGTIQVIQPG